jgi:hypothetical protein
MTVCCTKIITDSNTEKLPFLPSITAKCNAVLPEKKYEKQSTHKIMHAFLVCM